MAADKSISDIDLAEFQTPNRRASGLIKGAEAFHRISDEPEPEDAFMPALGLSPIKEYVEGKSGMLTIPDPKKIFTKCLDKAINNHRYVPYKHLRISILVV